MFRLKDNDDFQRKFKYHTFDILKKIGHQRKGRCRGEPLKMFGPVGILKRNQKRPVDNKIIHLVNSHVQRTLVQNCNF